MQRNQRRSDCPVHCALNILGDRWTLVVVRDLLFTERATYGELLQSPEKIATNTLASRLIKLEANGIVQRGDDARYRLTEKGLDLAPVLLELVNWAATHDASVVVPGDALDQYRQDSREYIANIKNSVRKRQAATAVNQCLARQSD